MLERLGLAFESWVRKNMPDPFVLVLLLTLLTFIMAALLHPRHESLALLPQAWLDGFWQLLSFAMQMVLIVATGEALVSTRPAQRLFAWISDQPKTPSGALWLLSSCALAAGWLHWGFGLIGSALLARQMAITLERKRIRVDYPLLGTAAYLAMLLWHAGTTASAPLLINTPGHFLEKTIGLIPLRETIFLPMNLAVCALLLALVPLLVVRMQSRQIRPLSDYSVEAPDDAFEQGTGQKATLGERLDENPWLGRAVGLIGLGTIAAQAFSPQGRFSLTHNTVNFLLLSLGLVIHGSAVRYARAIARSVRGTSGIILQYPFYGGIMGLIEGSGLGRAIAGEFIQFSTPHSLPFFSYLAATFTKLFVPSGGGEWAVEGPVMLEAARNLGASVGKTTMGIAYGNMVGNLFQPFWAMPLLSVLGLRARDIMGYCLVLFLFAFPILGAALLLSK
jgi:short-chain fatty acids transporter